jgi:hypothetical protein
MAPSESIPAHTTDVIDAVRAAAPPFDGFPYLVTRLVPALYHIALLPEDRSPRMLSTLLLDQTRANRLDTCLVLAADHAIYAEGIAVRLSGTEHPPCGGSWLTGRILTRETLPDTREMRKRRDRLEAWLQARAATGYMLGDITKGSRPATAFERRRFAGRGPDGVSRGLVRCRTCSAWRGRCLDPSAEFRGLVVEVHCRCDNHNRCARCGELLHELRLNANYYKPADDSVWHVPGFCGLAHSCRVATGGA